MTSRAPKFYYVKMILKTYLGKPKYSYKIIDIQKHFISNQSNCDYYRHVYSYFKGVTQKCMQSRAFLFSNSSIQYSHCA